MNEHWRWLYEHAREKDHAEASLADVLDVKASILLVVITFLAQVAVSVFWLESLPPNLPDLQLLNIGILVLGGTLLIAELWPRKYKFEDGDYLGELLAYIKDNADRLDSSTLDQILESNASFAIERIGVNFQLNSEKERFLKYAFRCVLIGVAIQLCILYVIAVQPK